MQFVITAKDAEHVLNLVAMGLASTQGQTDPEVTALREEWFSLANRLSKGIRAMNSAPVHKPIH